MLSTLNPGDLVSISDNDDFDPRVRGKIGIIVGKIEKYSDLVSVMVEGKIFGFFPTHLHYLEPISNSVINNTDDSSKT
jgi:hypothetical protein